MYYHVWFVTKYRKSSLAGVIDQLVKEIFTECMQRHSYKVLEFETNMDHVHMMVEVDKVTDLSGIIRTLKAVSAKEILQTQPFAMRNIRHFWGRRYGFREIGIAEIEHIRRYIRNQKA